MDITLLSTVVAPSFEDGRLTITSLLREDTIIAALAAVTRNLNGHPLTDAALRAVCPSLPAPERAFWDGSTLALAVRPKGGVRAAASNGDTAVTIDDLEFAYVTYAKL